MSHSSTPYAAGARVLHWTMFALITVQVVGGLAIAAGIVLARERRPPLGPAE